VIRRPVLITLQAAHEIAEAVTCALGWGLALTASLEPPQELRRVGNVIYLPTKRRAG
jgi:hypothetical protein